MRWGFVAALAAAVQHQPPHTTLAAADAFHVGPQEERFLAGHGNAGRVPARVLNPPPALVADTHVPSPAAPSGPAALLTQSLVKRASALLEWNAGTITAIVAAWVVAAVVVGVALWRCFRPRPEDTATDEEKIADLQENEEKLEAQLLAVRQTRHNLEDDSYAKRHPDEAKGDLRGLNVAIDKFVESRISTGVEKVRVAIARKDEAQAVLVKRYEVEQKRTLDSLKASAEGLMADVRGLADINLQDLDLTKGADELPPVAMVAAGMVAPAQLFALVFVNRALLAFHIVIAALDISVLLLSMNPQCGAEGAVVTLEHQLIWLAVHMSLHLIMLFIRIWVEYTIRSTYTRISKRDTPPAYAWAGNFRVLLQSDIDNPRALYLFDSITSSKMWMLASALLVTDFLWNCLGVMTFMTARAKCSDGYAVGFAMQMYGVLFTLFFLINCILLCLWMAHAWFMRPTSVANLLRSARQFDQHHSPAGIPFVTLLMRIFVFRDVSDHQHVEHQCLLREAKAVEAEEEKVLARLAELRLEKEALKEATIRVKKEEKVQETTEEAFTKDWLGKLEESFKDDGTGAGASFAELLEKTKAEVAQAVHQAQESEAFKQAEAMGREQMAKARSAAEESEALKGIVERAKHGVEDAMQAAEESEALKGIVERAKHGVEDAMQSEAVQTAVSKAKEGYERAKSSEAAQQMQAQASAGLARATEEVEKAKRSETVQGALATAKESADAVAQSDVVQGAVAAAKKSKKKKGDKGDTPRD